MEFVPGYEASVWFGVGAPKTTRVAIIEKLNTEINAALADPKIKARLASLGRVLPGSSADFGKFIEVGEGCQVRRYQGGLIRDRADMSPVAGDAWIGAARKLLPQLFRRFSFGH